MLNLRPTIIISSGLLILALVLVFTVPALSAPKLIAAHTGHHLGMGNMHGHHMTALTDCSEAVDSEHPCNVAQMQKYCPFADGENDCEMPGMNHDGMMHPDNDADHRDMSHHRMGMHGMGMHQGIHGS